MAVSVRAKIDDNKAVAFGVEKGKQALLALGWKMVDDIKLRMQRGSGKIYIRKSKTGKGHRAPHQASAEGQAPAVDTGRLRASITMNWSDSGMGRAELIAPVAESIPDDGIGQPSKDEGFTVVIGTNVYYGFYLETGTSRMRPRPFIRPTYDLFKPRIEKMLGQFKVDTTPVVVDSSTGAGGGEIQ